MGPRRRGCNIERAGIAALDLRACHAAAQDEMQVRSTLRRAKR